MSHSYPQPFMAGPTAMPYSYPGVAPVAPAFGVPPAVCHTVAPGALPQGLFMGGGAAGSLAHGIKADVYQLAGCVDGQQTQDVEKSGLPTTAGVAKSGGAMTNSLLSTMSKGGMMSYRSLLVDMQRTLTASNYPQLTSLSTSKPVDLNTPVIVKPATATRTRALFIGINYKGTPGELDGCHSDVAKMMQFAASHGYSMDANSCQVLMDDGKCTMPTKANIWAAFNWLIAGAQAGDALFLHFSGHGGQKKDISGDEASGWDSTMVPVDFKTAGQILDDDILAKVIKPLPLGVHMFAVMDCCHSATIMDLPYTVAVDQNTGAALTEGQMTTIAQNSKYNNGKRRVVDGEEAGMCMCCTGLGLMCADWCDLCGDSKANPNGVGNQAGVGQAMMCGGLAMCCADWCDLCGDSKKPQMQGHGGHPGYGV